MDASNHLNHPRLLRYIVADIVGFTQEPGEKQPRLISRLEQTIKQQTESLGDNVAYLQAGDAVCVVLPGNISSKTHLQVAMNIHLRALEPNLGDRRDWIKLRMAIGQGEDYEFNDINGRRNFAGAGLNETFRACKCCEPGELFVTEAAARNIKELEFYGSALKQVKTSFSKALRTEFTFYRFEGVINWAVLKW